MTTKPRKREGRNATQELGLRVARASMPVRSSVSPGPPIEGEHHKPGSVKKAPRIRVGRKNKHGRTPWWARGAVAKKVSDLA